MRGRTAAEGQPPGGIPRRHASQQPPPGLSCAAGFSMKHGAGAWRLLLLLLRRRAALPALPGCCCAMAPRSARVFMESITVQEAEVEAEAGAEAEVGAARRLCEGGRGRGEGGLARNS